MAWLDEAIEHLTQRPVCGYQCDEAPMVEPTALAALALLAAGRNRYARPALDWLLSVRSVNGSLGIDANTSQPCWPTGWAVLAWNTGVKRIPDAEAEWSVAAERAAARMLSITGPTVEIGSEQQRFLGHDTTLQGWPWVNHTHPWVEPTAISVLALGRAGQADCPRCREAVKLLLDRQLPQGGWNYGNTWVLGLDHMTRPQVEPTGVALAGLAGEPDIRPKVRRSLDLLMHTLTERTTTASLCYALLGLVEYGVWPEEAAEWLRSAYRRMLARGGSPYHTALLVLAAKKGEFHVSHK